MKGDNAMRTRSIVVGITTAVIVGMLMAAGVSSVSAELREHRQYDGSERKYHAKTVLEYYKSMWFHTAFVLQLEDNVLVRARDVYSRALHDIHESQNTKSVKKRFEGQLRKTIGDENYKKLMKSTADGRKRFFSRRSIRIKRWLKKRRKRGDRTDSYKEKIEKKS